MPNNNANLPPRHLAVSLPEGSPPLRSLLLARPLLP
jgi:hypothetical protein